MVLSRSELPRSDMAAATIAAPTKAARLAAEAGACTIQIGRVVCTRRAVIAIDRRRLGVQQICAVHMDDPQIYATAKANRWKWRVLLEP